MPPTQVFPLRYSQIQHSIFSSHHTHRLPSLSIIHGAEIRLLKAVRSLNMHWLAWPRKFLGDAGVDWPLGLNLLRRHLLTADSVSRTAWELWQALHLYTQGDMPCTKDISDSVFQVQVCHAITCTANGFFISSGEVRCVRSQLGTVMGSDPFADGRRHSNLASLASGLYQVDSSNCIRNTGTA